MAVEMGQAKGKLTLDASGFFGSIRSAIAELQAFNSEVSNASKGLKGLEQGASGAGKEIKNSASSIDTISTKLKSFGKAAESAGNTLSKYVTVPLAGIGAYSLKTSMNFEQAMSKVGAISGATGDELAQLSARAKELGSTTKFTNTQVAEAFTYMAMAGWKTEDMLEGIDGILSLSAASGADLARTSDIVTDALTAMGYEAKDAARLADVMAAASSNSNTNVELMGETFKYAAPLIGAMGYTMEDAAVAIGLMANAGIKGSQAGTSLRSTLTRLANPTKDVAAVMDELNISLETVNEDGTRSVKSLRDLMVDLRNSFGDIKIPVDEFQEALQGIEASRQSLEQQYQEGTITEKEYNKGLSNIADTEYKLTERAYGAEGAMKAQYASILAGKNALSGFLAIVNSSDEDFNALIDAVDTSEGSAQNMAETMLDNAAGSLTIFKSQLEAVATDIGDVLAPKLISLTGYISELVTKFSELDEETQNTIITFGLFAASVGPVLKIVGKLSTAIGTMLQIAPHVIAGISKLGSAVVSGIAKLAPAVQSGIAALGAPAALSLGTVLAGLVAFVAGYGLGTLIYDAIGPQIDEVLWPIFDKVVAVWESIVTFFTESIPEAFSTFVGYFSSGVDQITEFFSGIVASIEEFFTGVWETISETFTSIASWVNDNIIQPVLSVVVPIVTKIGEIIAKIWEIITAIFSVAATWVNTNVLQPIISGVSSFVNTIITFFQNLWDGIVDIFKALADWWDENVITPIGDLVSSLVEAIVDFFSDAWDGIIAIFSGIGDWFSDRWDDICDVFSGVADFFEGVFQDAVDAIEDVFGALSDWFSDLWDDICELFDYAATTVSSAFEEAFKGAFNGVMSLVEDAINFFVDAVNGVVDVINELPGVDIDKLDSLDLPRLSVGLDYVPYDDYQALLHKGERVLTKEENEAYTNGQLQGGNTFNFYSPNPIDEVTAAEEFKRVERELAEGIQ